ncbi:UDP-sugar transporter UST74c-like [Wyeomyia smithii]|uniref:UDP-sugar transporter UST74c-like n=1 Tax=Wyeomyia smithii TaxID=174621 RepID=UPI002467C2C2|nr:UDP-sugar transporter UST74c-like [Wyeomyia smithii]
MGANESPGSANDGITHVMKLTSAIFYGVASFLITVVNKTVLTSYQFPSFLVLSLGQLAASIIVLFLGKHFSIVKFPDFNRDIPRRIFPLPLIYLGNMMFGLGGTQALSLPMFAALRRFSILMTMILELRILGVRPSTAVQVSVYAMVGGALLAASDDLSFNLHGYLFVMVTNSLTAANGVYMKKKLDTADMGKYGLMYYNSLLMFLPALVGTWLCGDLDKAWRFEAWNDPVFAIQFLLSCVMGFILTYSTILCTQYNSALTTTIVGCLKNISVTYIGMFIGGDYVFSWLNSIGINISVAGSLLYTYVTFRKKSPAGGASSMVSNQAADRKALLPSSGRVDEVWKMLLRGNQFQQLRRVWNKNLCTAAAQASPKNDSDSNNASPVDEFTQEFLKNQIKLTDTQKCILSAGSSLAALLNPRRHDMIACLGETTGTAALENIRSQMLSSTEGRQVLTEKPRINTHTVNMDALRALPENSFGFHYVQFLEKHEITPDSRMEVRFMDDPELAYVMTRYRETHDLVHTVLDMPTNMLGEVAVKWVEAINTGLPMCYGGAVFGAFRLRPKQRQKYRQYYLPWAIQTGQRVKPLMCVYWEKRWDQDIKELRKELNINVLSTNL